MGKKSDEPGTGSPGPGGPGYPQTTPEVSLVPGAGGDDYPHNTTKISDFAKRSRELGKYLREQVLHRDREPVDPKDREAVREWTLEARNHSGTPEALDINYLDSDRPLDYHMLDIIHQQHSDMIRDVD